VAAQFVVLERIDLSDSPEVRPRIVVVAIERRRDAPFLAELEHRPVGPTEKHVRLLLVVLLATGDTIPKVVHIGGNDGLVVDADLGDRCFYTSLGCSDGLVVSLECVNQRYRIFALLRDLDLVRKVLFVPGILSSSIPAILGDSDPDACGLRVFLALLLLALVLPALFQEGGFPLGPFAIVVGLDGRFLALEAPDLSLDVHQVRKLGLQASDIDAVQIGQISECGGKETKIPPLGFDLGDALITASLGVLECPLASNLSEDRRLVSEHPLAHAGIGPAVAHDRIGVAVQVLHILHPDKTTDVEVDECPCDGVVGLGDLADRIRNRARVAGADLSRVDESAVCQFVAMAVELDEGCVEIFLIDDQRLAVGAEQ